MGGTPYADGSLFGRMFSHKGLPGTDDVPPKVLAYIEKNAPEFLEIPREVLVTVALLASVAAAGTKTRPIALCLAAIGDNVPLANNVGEFVDEASIRHRA